MRALANALGTPQDNLLPVSCRGEDWQGGMAMTLVDALDALVLFGREEDLAPALRRLDAALDFGAIDQEVCLRRAPRGAGCSAAPGWAPVWGGVAWGSA